MDNATIEGVEFDLRLDDYERIAQETRRTLSMEGCWESIINRFYERFGECTLDAVVNLARDMSTSELLCGVAGIDWSDATTAKIFSVTACDYLLSHPEKVVGGDVDGVRCS